MWNGVRQVLKFDIYGRPLRQALHAGVTYSLSVIHIGTIDAGECDDSRKVHHEKIKEASIKSPRYSLGGHGSKR